MTDLGSDRRAAPLLAGADEASGPTETSAPETVPAGAEPQRKSESRAPRQPRRLISPLTLRILSINILTLVIPVVGLLNLGQYRDGLIEAEIAALKSQARVFALSIGATAARELVAGVETLEPSETRSLVRILVTESGVRARIFATDGSLITDSYVLAGGGASIEIVELPPPEDSAFLRQLERWYQDTVSWLLGSSGLPRYQEVADATAEDFAEVTSALNGDPAGAARLDARDRLIVSAAVPIQRYRGVMGALLIAKAGAAVEEGVRQRRADILFVFSIALAATILLSLYLAQTLGRPIRRLAKAAERVRHGRGRGAPLPDFTHRHDENGDLSGALRDMTDAIWARLDAIEHFAADVAHELKNPLSSLSSAVETIARVKDPAQQQRLLSIVVEDVERLNRLIGDISDASRLDAALSRERTAPLDLATLLEALIEVYRATAHDAAGEPPQIELDCQGALWVRGLADRLGQVLRNLLDNAISFSPPGGRLTLTAVGDQSWVTIAVEDEGPGLPPEKLDAVFDRFYSERPSGEPFGTHSGLGLSISRQIVEAHGGRIVAENRLDAEGRVLGARFVIRLPALPRDDRL